MSDYLPAIGIIAGAIFWLASLHWAHREGIRSGILIECAQRDKENRPRPYVEPPTMPDLSSQRADIAAIKQAERVIAMNAALRTLRNAPRAPTTVLTTTNPDGRAARLTERIITEE